MTDREKALNKFNELLLGKSQQIINGSPFLFYTSVLDRETVEVIRAALLAKDEVQTVDASFEKFKEQWAKIVTNHQEKPDSWQPIETAPRDENKYLFFTIFGEIRTGRRVETILDDFETMGFKNGAHLSCCEYEEVTHWMPLPQPPKGEE